MADVYTDTTQMAALVKAAYDKHIEFALRPEPLYRAVADKRPVEVDKAGSTVTFHKYEDLAVTTTPLTELVTPEFVGVPDPTPVTVTLDEHGKVVMKTEKLKLFSFSEVDPAIGDIVAYNMRDTIDVLARTELLSGTNHITSNAGAPETAVALNTLTAADVISSDIIRTVVTKLRGASAVPRKDNLYWCALHPDSSYDLRSEAGTAGGWRQPHEYTAGTQIWAGEVGTYEGAFFIETPRSYFAADGASSAVVHRTLFAGKQALAEAVAREPGMVLGPVVDPLERFQPVGWKGLLGWAVFREESLFRVSHGTGVPAV